MSVPWIRTTRRTIAADKWAPGSGGYVPPDPGVSGELMWWDGAALQLAEVLGWWDGGVLQPVEVLGWWDGSLIQPLE
jgi:hypothetical protein